MTTTHQRHDKAQIDLWNIPSYVGTSATKGYEPVERLELTTTGRGLGAVVERMLTARANVLPSFSIYARIADGLDKLMSGPEEDEFGRVRPAEHAMIAAKGLLFHLAKRRSVLDPEDESTDRDGGIRISWRSSGRFLELVFPYETNIRPYLYFSEGALFDVREDLSPGNLDRWIAWIEGGPNPKQC